MRSAKASALAHVGLDAAGAANLRAGTGVPFGLAQLRPAGLGGGERGLGALADRLTLLLGDQRHDADREPVGVRHVDGDELDAGLLAGQAGSARRGSSRSSLAMTSLALKARQASNALASAGRLSSRLPLSTSTCSSTSVQSPPFSHVVDRGALRLEAKAAFALPLGGNAQVGDEFAVMLGHDTSNITKVTGFVKSPFS